MSHCWEPLSPFSAAGANRQIPRSPAPETWGFPLTRLSPRQCTAERLRTQQVPPIVFRTIYTCLCPMPGVSNSTLRADINQPEMVQRLATRLLRDLRHVPYEGRLRQLNLISLERRRLRFNLLLAFDMFTVEIGMSPSKVFVCLPRTRLRGHTYRMLQGLKKRSGFYCNVTLIPSF